MTTCLLLLAISDWRYLRIYFLGDSEDEKATFEFLCRRMQRKMLNHNHNPSYAQHMSSVCSTNLGTGSGRNDFGS